MYVSSLLAVLPLALAMPKNGVTKMLAIDSSKHLIASTSLSSSPSTASTSRPGPLLTDLTHPKVFCVGIRTSFEDLPSEYQRGRQREFHVTCEEGPVETWMKDTFQRCARKCKAPDCVAWTFEGDKDVGRCDYHQKWLVGPPLAQAYSTVLAAEANLTAKSYTVTPETWSQGKSPVGDSWPSTASLEFSIPESMLTGYVWKNPLASSESHSHSITTKIVNRDVITSTSVTMLLTPAAQLQYSGPRVTYEAATRTTTSFNGQITSAPIPSIDYELYSDTFAARTTFKIFDDSRGVIHDVDKIDEPYPSVHSMLDPQLARLHYRQPSTLSTSFTVVAES